MESWRDPQRVRQDGVHWCLGSEAGRTPRGNLCCHLPDSCLFVNMLARRVSTLPNVVAVGEQVILENLGLHQEKAPPGVPTMKSSVPFRLCLQRVRCALSRLLTAATVERQKVVLLLRKTVQLTRVDLQARTGFSQVAFRQPDIFDRGEVDAFQCTHVHKWGYQYFQTARVNLTRSLQPCAFTGFAH